MQSIHSSPTKPLPLLPVQLGESYLQKLIKEANGKAELFRGAVMLRNKRHQRTSKTLSKIFALETWRRRQHEHLIRQLERVTETLEDRLTTSLKECSSLISRNEKLEQELTTHITTIKSFEQRNASLLKANSDLKTQAESLISTLVAATNENKTLRERDIELRQKLEEAEARVSKVLAIKSERVLQNSKYLPVGIASLHDVQRRQFRERDTQDAKPKSLVYRSKNLPEADKNRDRHATTTTVTTTGTHPTMLKNCFSKTVLSAESQPSIPSVSTVSGYGNRLKLTMDTKRRPVTGTSTDADSMKPKTRVKRALSKELTTLGTRTPLRDRLRSRAKKAS